ncbi:hypothetical protein HK096_006410 [Nowakowskiella sp. JEL0078]|nr:hypothetical protein HK096_006410 [Nowakowskiella sp. JEL0078]
MANLFSDSSKSSNIFSSLRFSENTELINLPKVNSSNKTSHKGPDSVSLYPTKNQVRHAIDSDHYSSPSMNSSIQNLTITTLELNVSQPSNVDTTSSLFNSSNSDNTAFVEDTLNDFLSDSNKRYSVHQVSNTDTLPGIALKYGVSVYSIKTANRISFNEDMFARGTLLIPEIIGSQESNSTRISDDRKKEVKKFQVSTQCSFGEAWEYMKTFDFNSTEALKCYWTERDNKNIIKNDESTMKTEGRHKSPLDSHPLKPFKM